MFFQSISELDV